MKGLWCGFAFALMCSVSLVAQDRERSHERISLALQQPPPILRSAVPPGDDFPKKIGPLTLVQPTKRGEFVRVSVPVGALVTGALHRAAAVHRRQRERAARREVEAALRSIAERPRTPSQ
jgi:hypothetical protein